MAIPWRLLYRRVAWLPTSPGDLPGATPTRISKSTPQARWRLKRGFVGAWSFNPATVFVNSIRSSSHSAWRPLRLNAPGFANCRFGRGYVGLELNGISAGIGDGVNESVGHSQAAVMCLSYLSYHKTSGLRRQGFVHHLVERKLKPRRGCRRK